MTHRLLGLMIASLLASGLASARAEAEDINFALHSERFGDGVLSGTFYGLSPIGTSSPTAIYLTGTSYRASYPPFSEYLSGLALTTSGGFNIEDGQLIDAEFSFSDQDTADSLVLSTSSNSFSAKVGGELYFSRPEDQETEGGFMTFSVSSAPEPSTWLLMIVGLAGLGLSLRRIREVEGQRLETSLIS